MTLEEKIRNLSRKWVKLPALSAAAGERIEAQIRKVTEIDVMANAGFGISIYALMAERQEGESNDDLRKRLQGETREEMAEKLEAGLEFQSKLRQALLRVGLAAIRAGHEVSVVKPGSFDISDLGADYNFLADEISAYSGLDFFVSPEEGETNVTTFPEGQEPSAARQPDGPLLRHEPGEPAETPPGGLLPNSGDVPN